MHERVVEPLVGLAVAVSMGLVLALSVRRRDLVTPLVSVAGALVVLAGRYALEQPLVTAAGAALLVGAALVNAVRCRQATLVPGDTGADPGNAS